MVENSLWQLVIRKVLGVGILVWNFVKIYVVVFYILSNYIVIVEVMERKVSGYLRKWF